MFQFRKVQLIPHCFVTERQEPLFQFRKVQLIPRLIYRKLNALMFQFRKVQLIRYFSTILRAT